MQFGADSQEEKSNCPREGPEERMGMWYAPNLNYASIEISVISREEMRNNVHLCTQSPVRYLKKEGPSLWMSPEKQYPDDFEPYETEDMEVRIKTRVCVLVSCVYVCVFVQTRGGAMCQKQLSVLFSIAPSMPLSPDANTLFPRRAPAHVLLTVPVPQETPPSCPGRPVQQIRSTTRRCFWTWKKLR